MKTSGVILHPLSFYSSYPSGELDDCAKEILIWLKNSGFSLLQILPLGPTGFGNSPYQSFSSFAGTPYIISFDYLIRDGFLKQEELNDFKQGTKERVDYYFLYNNVFKILFKAFERFKNSKCENFLNFCNENEYWLQSYSFFMALKDYYNGKCWYEWNKEHKNFLFLKNINDEVKGRALFYKFIQWIFFSQWIEFKNYANKLGIKIIGDLPIFVSYDSADVWANQRLFKLKKDGKPEVVAGVPPDYFSKTGQLWGNPIYKWEALEEERFDWWIKRVSHILKIVDCVRLDHFRGFDACWEIKYGNKTAKSGRWVKTPGESLFRTLNENLMIELKDVFIAEDLGVITEDVVRLREKFKLPGMRIFEFAKFPSSNDEIIDDPYLPENYIENCVAYPGTHDNDTIIGWFESLSETIKNDVLHYLKIKDIKDLNYAIIEALLNSKADRVIFLMQDILCLDSTARMNKPGTMSEHNWSWRLKKEQLTLELSKKLFDLNKKYGRI